MTNKDIKHFLEDEIKISKKFKLSKEKENSRESELFVREEEGFIKGIQFALSLIK